MCKKLLMYKCVQCKCNENHDIMAFFLFLPIVGVGVRGVGDGARCDCKTILDPFGKCIPFVVDLTGDVSTLVVPLIIGNPFNFPFPLVR